MASNVIFDNPPLMQGTQEDQLTALYRYLQTTSEKLNEALMAVSMEQLAPEVQVSIREGSAEQQEKRNFQTQKDLIIKTARLVRTSMDEIRATLETRVEAISDQFGELESVLTDQIAVTAEGLRQDFTLQEEIIQNTVDGHTSQINNYLSYIHAGIIDYDSQTGDPITGIAIGEGVTNADGTVNLGNAMATFTASRLTFYQGNAEVGYYANNVFHIARGEVTSTMKIGNHTWTKLADGSLALLAGS